MGTSHGKETPVNLTKLTYNIMDGVMGSEYRKIVPELTTKYGFDGSLSVKHLTKCKENWAQAKPGKGNKNKEMYEYEGKVLD